MRSFLRILLAGVVMGGVLFVANPKPAQADDYWDGYWSWYDNTYRPYYQRYYRPAPRYYNDGYYDGYGYYYPGQRYYYNYPGEYYGTPRFGYRNYPDGGGSIRVGPLRFGWR